MRWWDHFNTCLLLSQLVKEIWKSKISWHWQSYGQKWGVLFSHSRVSLSLLTMRKWNKAVLYTCHNFNWWPAWRSPVQSWALVNDVREGAHYFYSTATRHAVLLMFTSVLINVIYCRKHWSVKRTQLCISLTELKVKQESVRPRWPYDMRPSVRAEKYIRDASGWRKDVTDGNDNGTDGETDRQTDRQTDRRTECDAICGPLL